MLKLKPPTSVEYVNIRTLSHGIKEQGIDLDLDLTLPLFSWTSYRHRSVPLDHFRDSLSPHQLYSKAWIIKTLLDMADHFSDEEEEAIEERLLDLSLYVGEPVSLTYCGSWLGLGAVLVAGVAEYFANSVKQIALIDSDDKSMAFAKDFVTAAGFNARYLTQDLLEIHQDDSCWKNEIIVNPILEHLTKEQITKWWELIKASRSDNMRLIVLQSTDMPADDHVNKCSNVEELKLDGLDVLYTGQLQFENCSRFMVIGMI